MYSDEAPGISLRDLVLEIRQDVKALDSKIEKIDRTGSIGTREELSDHETRIRHVEKWMYGIPVAAIGAIAAIILPFLPGIS